MIRPWLGLLCVFLTFSISFGLFVFTPIDVDDYFFVSIFILIAIYTILAITSDSSKYQPRKWLQNPLKIGGKYLFWAGMTYTPLILYRSHSFYSQTFPNVQPFFEFYFNLYLIAGLPYFILSEKYRYSISNFLNDPFLRVLSFVRGIKRGEFKTSFNRLFRHRAYRNFIVSSSIRLHFLPIMVNQIYFTHQTITKSLIENRWDYLVIVAFLTSLVWAIDANNASIGYFWESNFTKTRFRAMDPYPLHWIITLSCYMPFTIWATTFLPALMDHNSAVGHLVEGSWFQISTDILGLLFLIGYIYAGTSLYFSTSNMTYKAIQTRGFYSIVRHPATLCKVGFFGIVTFKFAAAYTLINVLAYIIWTGIYIARTLCEERFLCHFEEYRTYKAKVKYRIIPGIF